MRSPVTLADTEECEGDRDAHYLALYNYWTKVILSIYTIFTILMN